MTDLYLHGRSLISALGHDLQRAVGAVARGAARPQRRALPGGTDWPWFGIDHTESSWRQRARALLNAAVEQAGIGPAQRHAPLFIGTSSFHIGAFEAGEDMGLDYHSFAQEVAGWLSWHGPVILVSTACTSSMQALLAAAAHIRAGASSEAVVLGLELANRFTLAGFAGMQLLSRNAALPLGMGRDGLVLGEAVAAMHLSHEPARWKLSGGAALVDGRDPTGARPDTVAQLCRQVLAQSGGNSAGAIDLVKLQAAGSPHNDAHEIEGLRQVFEELPALVSLKAMMGHTLGACGAAEIALLLECLERNVLPPVDYPLDANIGAPLALVPPPEVRSVLAIILGFGGGYAAVALEDQDG